MFNLMMQTLQTILLASYLGVLAAEPNKSSTEPSVLNITTTQPLLVNRTGDETTESPGESQTKNSSEIYGSSDAEQLGELSVIDILFRKRRSENFHGDTKKQSKKAYSPVIVEEEMEFSYEEFGDDTESSASNQTTTTEQAKPSAEGENQSPTLSDLLVPPPIDAVQEEF